MSRKQANRLWQNYMDRHLKQIELEPNWVHSCYESIRDYALGLLDDPDEIEEVKSLVKSFSVPDGTEMQAFSGLPGSPKRIIQDGWRIGTPTWVFLGRAMAGSVVEDLGDGWVLVGRPIPAKYRVRMPPAAPMSFIAYHQDKQMGGTTFTAGCIGPAETRYEIVRQVQLEKESWPEDTKTVYQGKRSSPSQSKESA